MTTKLLTKKFASFEAEEKWLNALAKNGWLLVSYRNDDFGKTDYTFEKHERAMEGHYKIDFVTFKNRDDFDEYAAILEEGGWELLAKSENYDKLISFSTTAQRLFSDSASASMRDERKQKKASRNAWIFVGIAALCGIGYWIFDNMAWLAFAIIYAATSVHFIVTACRLNVRLQKSFIDLRFVKKLLWGLVFFGGTAITMSLLNIQRDFIQANIFYFMVPFWIGVFGTRFIDYKENKRTEREMLQGEETPNL